MLLTSFRTQCRARRPDRRHADRVNFVNDQGVGVVPTGGSVKVRSIEP